MDLSTFSHCQIPCCLWLGIVGRHPYGTELCTVPYKAEWEKGIAQERSVHAHRQKKHSVSFPFSTATGLVNPRGRGSRAVFSFWIKLALCCMSLPRLAVLLDWTTKEQIGMFQMVMLQQNREIDTPFPKHLSLLVWSTSSKDKKGHYFVKGH